MIKIFKNNKPQDQEAYTNVIEGLNRLYTQKLLPLETAYKFHDFHSPALESGDFHSKPMVLLIGQYSTGKTTFIRYLLDQDFPGMRIGPEPTTDSFIAVMYGEREGVIPGNALVMDHKKQFRPMSRFGNSFLNRFQCAHLPNEVLESLTFIDTPGILSGEKQRVDRGYEFSGVIEWFAERVDRIILLFDAHKLDISDEFRRVIEVLKASFLYILILSVYSLIPNVCQGNEDKIRIVLNKADTVDSQQLMRVYGALMWSLGKILYTPEVARVFIGSFWDHPLTFDQNRKLFELEEQDLFRDLGSLPGDAALRKLNDFIRRARLAKVHAYIIAHLKNEMPALMGREAKKRELITNLSQVYETLSRTHHISIGDFPNVTRMQETLALHDFRSFPNLQPKLIKAVDDMLANDMAKLMQMIPQVHAYIIAHLKNEMPALMGREAKKRELITNLSQVYETLSRTHHISIGDFPNVTRMQETLALHDFRSFPNLQPKLIKAVDDMLANDMAKLMQMIPQEKIRVQEQQATAVVKASTVRGGAFDSLDTPFSYHASEGINQGMFDSDWIVSRDRAEADAIFLTLNPVNGKISGESARKHMLKSHLPNSTLRKIWILGDVDRDGCLDEDEFALVLSEKFGSWET
ncbi:hypothetical protein AHF37_03537 [Paragonimus kellicotti]|nr:hypothetical protein AHF37_03537 [Paragonimus kellicotti]